MILVYSFPYTEKDRVPVVGVVRCERRKEQDNPLLLPVYPYYFYIYCGRSKDFSGRVVC